MELLAAFVAGWSFGFGLATGSMPMLILALVAAVAGFMLSLCK